MRNQRTLMAVFAILVIASPLLGQVPKERSIINLQLGSINDLAFSPDGKFMAIAGDKGVKIWDIDAGKEKTFLKGNGDDVVNMGSLTFTDEGGSLITTYANFSKNKKSVVLWDLGTGKEEKTILEGEVKRLVLSPDRKTLACMVEEGVRLFDWPSGKERKKLEVPASDIAFVFGGKSLAVVYFLEEGHIYEVATGKEQQKLPTSKGVRVAADGKTLILGSLEEVATIWDAEKAKKIAELKGHTSSIEELAISPDGKTAATFELYNVMRIWDVAMAKERGAFRTRDAKSLVFSPDSKMFAAAKGDSVVLWNMEEGSLPALPITIKENKTLKLGKKLTSMTLSGDGKLIAAALAGPVHGGGKVQGITVWNVATDKEKTFLKAEDPVNRLAISPDSKLVAWRCEEDTTVYVGDIDSAKVKHKLKGHDAPIRVLVFAPDGKTLATASQNGVIKVWDLDKGKEIASLNGHKDGVYALAFSPKDANLLAAGGGPTFGDRKKEMDTVTLWDIARKKEKTKLTGHKNHVYSLAFSTDGKMLAASAENLRIWDVATGKEITCVLDYGGANALSFSPDNKTLAVYNGELVLFDVASGKEKAFVAAYGTQSPYQGGFGMSYSPDGKFIITGGRKDTELQLWETPKD